MLVGSRTLDSNAEPFDGRVRDQPMASRSTASIRPGKMGYNWQWNVSVQREIARNTTLEVGYVGSKGFDLLQPYDVNQVRWRPQRSASPTSTRAATRTRPRRSGRTACSATRSIAILDHSGKTTYNSLQTQLVSRFGHGSQFQASYTLSQTTGNVHADRRRERRRRLQRQRPRQPGARRRPTR